MRTAQKARPLTLKAYDNLAQASRNNPVSYYSAPAKNLFSTVMMKYMMPKTASPAGSSAMSGTSGMSGQQMEMQ